MNRRICLRGAALFLHTICGFARIHGAPLTWFPGPPLLYPDSGAATVFSPSLGNVVLGGDSYYYSENLVATNTSWTFLFTVYSPYIASGAVSDGDFIVVYGGTDGTNSQSTVIGYSPSGDGSQTFASMSVARSYLGYAADRSGNAYAIGGLDANGQPLSSAESYSQDAGTWSPIASLPGARYNFPAAFDGTNQIYALGGYTNASSGTETADVLRYSVSRNTWTNLPPMPLAVAGSIAAFGADGKLYVVGGLSGGAATNLVQVFTPSANSWTISTPLPEALSASAMGVDSLGRLIIMGGADAETNDVADVWRSQQLGVPDSAPVFTQFPATNGLYANLYTSSILATGNPQPVYTLVSGPTNMAVDYFSGAITWTPLGGAEIGNIPVTIQASNYAGATNWMFAITVPPPPPIVPTNLTVVSTTDNSVTLTWDPEDPLVGPVTYKVYWEHSAGPHGGVIYTLEATTSNTVVMISPLNLGSSYEFTVTATAGSHTTGYAPGVVGRTTTPQPPTNVRLIGATSRTLTLAWDPSPGPAQSPNYSVISNYTIMQFHPGLIFTPYVTGIPTNMLFGTVTGLTPGSSAFWTVEATDTQGNSTTSYAYLVAATNPVPVAAQMSAAAFLAGGGFQFSVTENGTAPQTVLIQASTNLSDPNSWLQIGSLFPAANPFTFTDTNAAQFPARFYRVVSP